MIRHFNRTKIVATVGPACNTKEKLYELVNAGVNVFRVNFSHGTHEEAGKFIDLIKKINIEYGRTIAILADLQGPKIRVGKIKDNAANLIEGDLFTITTEECIGDEKKASITYQELPKDVSKGDRILLDDGRIELVVEDTDKNKNVITKIAVGGILSSNKGVNLPNTKISQPSLTKKDRLDLEFALEKDVHWIALSFVRKATDIYELKKIIRQKGKLTKVIAKIEKPEAIEDLDNIIEETDAVMVARGDLGVEVPMEDIPTLQKQIVTKCIRASRPVIIATQLMENMINNPRPTRAEITDVANSVLDGADAVMLSAETSVGKYPRQVIELMTKIINKVEKDDSLYIKSDGSNKWGNTTNPDSPAFLAGAIIFNAAKISDDVSARAIVGITKLGYTAHKLSSFRPKSKIFIFSDNPMLLNQLSLVWGCKAFFYDKFESTDETILDIKHILKVNNYLMVGDFIINLASMPIHLKLRTNTMKISMIE